MEESTTKEMTITMKADGKIKEVKGKDNKGGSAIGKKIPKTPNKEMTLVAVILHSVSSPDCWYYYLANGECHEICW